MVSAIISCFIHFLHELDGYLSSVLSLVLISFFVGLS